MPQCWTTYVALCFAGAKCDNFVKFLAQFQAFVATTHDRVVCHNQASEGSECLFKSGVVFVFWLECCNDSLSSVQFHQFIANHRRVLSKRADEEHRLDDELLTIDGLNQTQETLESAHADEHFHARLVASHDARNRVESVAGDFGFVGHHLDELRKNVEFEQVFLAERIVLRELADKKCSLAADFSVFRVEARKNDAKAADLEEI